jgi:hypothetical protein
MDFNWYKNCTTYPLLTSIKKLQKRGRFFSETGGNGTPSLNGRSRGEMHIVARINLA